MDTSTINFYQPLMNVDSKVTTRGQTTLPSSVRRALNLRSGSDRVHYEILPGGKVLMSRVEEEE